MKKFCLFLGVLLTPILYSSCTDAHKPKAQLPDQDISTDGLASVVATVLAYPEDCEGRLLVLTKTGAVLVGSKILARSFTDDFHQIMKLQIMEAVRNGRKVEVVIQYFDYEFGWNPLTNDGYYITKFATYSEFSDVDPLLVPLPPIINESPSHKKIKKDPCKTQKITVIDIPK